MPRGFKLTDEQKDFLVEEFEKTPDLNVLTKLLFKDDSLDGRSKEGRAIKAFLKSKGLDYRTTEHEKAEEVVLTDSQKKFILMQMEDSGLSSVAIANLLFKDKKLTPLCKETRAVLEFMRENDPEYNSDAETTTNAKYSPPQALSRIIKKVFESTGIEIEEDKMNRQTKLCLDKLKINLNNKRFVFIMSNIKNVADRDLLESEFIRHTWDKPDLTADEVSLYINLAKEFVILETCTKHIEKLKQEFDNVAGDEKTGDGKMTVTLSEIIKTKTDEYHKSCGRIESLIKKLQGDRATRIKESHQTNASILSLVQAFQDEDERRVALDIANKQRAAIEIEVNRLEKMSDFKCRILGIGKKDVL